MPPRAPPLLCPLSTTARIFDAAEVLGLDVGKAIVLYRGSGARFSMPRYNTDYPAEKEAAIEPRPQIGFVQRAEAEAATA